MKEYNLVKAFEDSILKSWDSPSLSNYNGETLLFKDVAKEIIKLHILFEKCGVTKKDKIALIGKNSTKWALVYLATVSYGATIVPILPDFHYDNMQNIINHSDSKLLFTDDTIVSKLDIESLDNLKAIINLTNTQVIKQYNGLNIDKACKKLNELIKEQYPEGIDKSLFKLPEVDDNHTAVISYTSGTTGFSKGVMLSLDSLMANVYFAWNNMHLETGDTLLSILPLAHAYGCAFEFLWPFTKGVHITFLGKVVSPQVMIQAYKEIKPRVLLMVPLILEKIYKKQLQPVIQKPIMRILLKTPLLNRIIFNKIRNKLRETFGGNFHEVIIGGAALNKEVERFLRRIKFNFSVGYGMTECGPLISYANWDKIALSSCGQLVDTLEIMVDSPDSENIPGEIMVRGINVMQGYYKNREETDKVIDKEGWLHTGDLGVVDKNNFIFLRGRSKCMILGPSGENIYPEEIESKLSTFPYVQEQIVISHKNRLVALVYPDMEKASKHGLKERELEKIMIDNMKVINKTLPKYSQLAQIKLWKEEFEKTPKQSIKRFKYENMELN